MYYGVYQEACMMLIFNRFACIHIDIRLTVCILIMDERLM